jgi:hypothetical protein
VDAPGRFCVLEWQVTAMQVFRANAARVRPVECEAVLYRCLNPWDATRIRLLFFVGGGVFRRGGWELQLIPWLGSPAARSDLEFDRKI